MFIKNKYTQRTFIFSGGSTHGLPVVKVSVTRYFRWVGRSSVEFVFQAVYQTNQNARQNQGDRWLTAQSAPGVQSLPAMRSLLIVNQQYFQGVSQDLNVAVPVKVILSLSGLWEPGLGWDQVPRSKKENVSSVSVDTYVGRLFCFHLSPHLHPNLHKGIRKEMPYLKIPVD